MMPCKREKEVTLMRGFRYYLPGALLVLLGALVLAVPEILVAFVSAALAVTGFGVLVLGHRMRKAEKEWRQWENPGFDERSFGPTFFSRQTYWF